MFFEDLNNVHVTGNLTRGVELRSAPNGTKVANIRIGVNGRRKEGEEWVDKPNFFTVTCFGKAAENAFKYLAKGRRILVEGRLDWSEWTADGEDKKRQGVQIIASRIMYLPSKSSIEAQASSGQDATDGSEADWQTTEAPASTEEPVAAGVGAEEEIPF